MKKTSLLNRGIALGCAVLLSLVALTSSSPVRANELKQIRTESELRDAFFDAGSYTLGADITLTNTILLCDESGQFAYGNIILDLNGHTISASKTIFEVRGYGKNETGNVTILDSAGGGGLQTTGANNCPILFSNASNWHYRQTFTINGGSYKSEGTSMRISSAVPASSVVINTGTFYSATQPIIGACTLNKTHFSSEDGRILYVGKEKEPSTSVPSTESPTDGTQPTTVPEPTTEPTSDVPKSHVATLDASAVIPRANYVITIPATIPVTALERTEAEDAARISTTGFSVEISEIEHFFSEKAVNVFIKSGGVMTHESTPEARIPFTISKGDAPYDTNIPFAVLNETTRLVAGTIDIDRSTIRTAGKYMGTMEFSIVLVSLVD